MSLAILSKPHWQGFLHLPGMQDLPHASLMAADDFFDFVRENGLAMPTAADMLTWARREEPDPDRRLQDLENAFACILPGAVNTTRDARERNSTVQPAREPEDTSPRSKRRNPEAPVPAPAVWDPIAPPPRPAPTPRKVSVPPGALPPAFREQLRRAASGLPGNGVFVSKDILKRMREKLCQFTWAARTAGLSDDLCVDSINHYLDSLQSRLENRAGGLRWATLRATAEELYRYARYAGYPDELLEFLRDRHGLLEAREGRQKALKHFALAETGNTTDKVLDMADGELARAAKLDDPEERHRTRNGACIIGIFPVAPLRNSSAYLVFGKSLFFRNCEWVIDTMIRKTRRHNPEPFVMPLHPDHSKFIDAVILGDNSPTLLPKLRDDVLRLHRPLFVHFNGTPSARSYAPRRYKELTGNSFTTTRSMLHTDLAVTEGGAGVRIAMIAGHQTGEKTAEKYQLAQVAMAAVASRQASLSARRARHLEGCATWRDSDVHAG